MKQNFGDFFGGAMLVEFATAFANYLPVTIGAVTYLHASEDEQARMKEIVKRSLLVGAAVGAGASLGMFLVQYGVFGPLGFAVTYIASHTVAIGGEVAKIGVLYSVFDVIKNRGVRQEQLED